MHSLLLPAFSIYNNKTIMNINNNDPKQSKSICKKVHLNQ